MESYTAQQSGLIGYEILNPEGEIIVWANGFWAAMIVALLNDAEGREFAGKIATGA